MKEKAQSFIVFMATEKKEKSSGSLYSQKMTSAISFIPHTPILWLRRSSYWKRWEPCLSPWNWMALWLWQKWYNVTSKGRWSKVRVSIWFSWDTCLWSPEHHVRCPRLSCRWYRGQYRFPHYSPSWDSWQQSDSTPRFMSEDFPSRWFLSPAVEISQPLVLFSWHHREEGVSCHYFFLSQFLNHRSYKHNKMVGSHH